MTAAYFEDHPTDPDKVILRKPKHDFGEQKPMHPQLKAMLEEYFDKCFAESAAQRTWVGLTEAQCGVLWKTNMTPFEYYQAIEAKLKEKNND
jgi:hypothetical protein